MVAHGWCLMVHGARGPRATQNDSTLMLSVPVGFPDIATPAYLGLGACVAREAIGNRPSYVAGNETTP
jgi:hypothetical protein